MLQYFHSGQAFPLALGGSLPAITVAYHTYGRLNERRDNVIWICHALTASSDAADWWPGMVGSGCAFDTDKYFIVCANIIGSCYGSTGPLSVNPETSKPYLHSFPTITIRDMVQAFTLLRAHLGIAEIHLLAGGSMGGYQALEWTLMEPECIQNLFLIATSATESAWGIAIHTAQRLAIEADASWLQDNADAGAKGLKAARAIGMLTYRNYEQFYLQQTDADPELTRGYKAESYIQYQGDKLVNRFNAFSYYLLGRAMDSHHIARGRFTTAEAALASIRQHTLLIGISSDMLCPVQEQRFMAAHLPLAQYVEIDSPYGHDGFLTETEKISVALKDWMEGL